MRIAVIGAGISGNIAARALSAQHDVTIYEKRARPGGHSATVDIEYDGVPISVDTGFIVYNELNYPNFTALLNHLDVATEASDMSFGFSADNGRVEWAGSSLNTIFAQRSNLISPRFLSMLREILRFNKIAADDLANNQLSAMSLGDYLDANGFSDTFANQYLLPMGAAIWSTPIVEMKDYPAESFISFFENHRLIHFDRPTWRTIKGGSRNYVSKLLAPLQDKLRLGAEVVGIRRENGLVHIKDAAGHSDTFDHVILASHTDQSLAMLEDPSEEERSLLSRMRYRPNTVYLHRDTQLMPKRERVWSSWNFMADTKAGATSDVTVSYWMNRLQNIDQSKHLFVTLNPSEAPADDRTFAQFTYDHPQFDAAALSARKQLEKLQGTNNTWFCGAWAGSGFHEDGISSGLRVARALGAAAPWEAPVEPQVLEAAE